MLFPAEKDLKIFDQIIYFPPSKIKWKVLYHFAFTTFNLFGCVTTILLNFTAEINEYGLVSILFFEISYNFVTVCVSCAIVFYQLTSSSKKFYGLGYLSEGIQYIPGSDSNQETKISKYKKQL